MHPIPDILNELRAGRMIVLCDDESREDEGDLVVAAEFATPEALIFMLREACGMMCVALDGPACDRLELPPLTAVSTTQRSTAYTVTVDGAARFGVTTGVSAVDRAATVRLLVDPTTKPSDLARPGHMQPLRARDGGVLVRTGQTEGSVDLCRLAGLKPAAVIIEVMKPDGTMARRPDLEIFCQQHALKMCTVAQVIEHRLASDSLVERVESVPFENEFGTFTLHAFRSEVDPFPHVALTVGDLGGVIAGNSTDPVLVRMHSQNLLGDVFGDQTQPSGSTLRTSMKMIQEAGRGAIVYLRHDRMGSGLLQRLQTRHEDLENDDPHPLHGDHATPGTKPSRHIADYGIGSQILRDLGITRLRLITNHPMTPTALSGFGLEIAEFVPVG